METETEPKPRPKPSSTRIEAKSRGIEDGIEERKE